MDQSHLETQQTWNKLADLYAVHFMDLACYTPSYARFCDLLTQEKPTLLELGCGPGNITRHLLTLKPDAHILATDYAENMVIAAQKHNPKAQCIVLDAREISTLDQQFDGIVCGFVLPYLSPSECQTLLQDCASLLNPGGLLYISFVPGNPAHSGYITGSTGDRCYFYYQEKAAFLSDLSAHFSILDVEDIDYRKSDGSTEVHTVVIAQMH